MANRYGEAALMAVRMETYGKALTPAERWQDAVTKLYPNSPINQKKGGPRNAFLGLCEQGLVKGIAAGVWTKPHANDANKACAVKAIALLRAGTHKTVTELWGEVNEDPDKTHNSQMDVVLALWKNGLIVA
jgi:hypothetical protein